MKFPATRPVTTLILRITVSALAFVFMSAAVFAQDDLHRLRKVVTATDPDGFSRLETESDLVPFSQMAPPKSVAEFASPAMQRFNNLLRGAINERLGSPYVYGATGPFAFDCSGFVWSAFQEVGISFERASARSLWAKFAPATDVDRFKLGTLVFFNGLNHIGIVADENGFYHASRSHGVKYSPFNKYWSERIDGFRRVPMSTPVLAE